jgi:hypothetical protein
MKLQHHRHWCCCELPHCADIFCIKFVSKIEVSSEQLALCARFIEVTGVAVNTELHVTGRESGYSIRVSDCIVQELVDISFCLLSGLGRLF